MLTSAYLRIMSMNDLNQLVEPVSISATISINELSADCLLGHGFDGASDHRVERVYGDGLVFVFIRLFESEREFPAFRYGWLSDGDSLCRGSKDVPPSLP